MEKDKPKKRGTPALVAIVFGATLLGLSLIGLAVFVWSGSGGPARTKLGNELVGTIEAVDGLAAELDETSGCSINPRTFLAKYQKINDQVFAVIAETLNESRSGMPSDDLIADLNHYNPLLQTKAGQLEEKINRLVTKCGLS